MRRLAELIVTKVNKLIVIPTMTISVCSMEKHPLLSTQLLIFKYYNQSKNNLIIN